MSALTMFGKPSFPGLRSPTELGNEGEFVIVSPTDDGFVTDSNFDNVGDFATNGFNSVLVGFNAFGPGEHRGVYEFDLRPLGSTIISARLRLNRVGSRMNGTDPHLTLYAGSTDGFLGLDDFNTATMFVTSFYANDLGPFERFDNIIDVTSTIQTLKNINATHVAFVIHPNPASRNDTGGLLFSSLEISGDSSYQFLVADMMMNSIPTPGGIALVTVGCSAFAFFRRNAATNRPATS